MERVSEERVPQRPHAARWSSDLLINSAYFQARRRLREGRGGGRLHSSPGGGRGRRERIARRSL